MGSLITSLINILTDTEFLGMPLFVWVLIPLLLTVVISFLKGD